MMLGSVSNMVRMKLERSVSESIVNTMSPYRYLQPFTYCDDTYRSHCVAKNNSKSESDALMR